MAGINKLSSRQVEAIRKNKTVGKHYDGGGLFLHATDGGGLYWRYKYRLGGKEKLYAIGTLDDVTLAEAREKHSAARKMVDAGLDPVEEKRKSKADLEAARAAARPFRESAQEWLNEIILPRQSQRTIDRSVRIVGYLNAAFGKKPITEIGLQDLTTLLLVYERAGKFETRQRIQQVAVSIMSFLAGRGFIKVNPFLGVRFTDAFTSADSARESRPALTDPQEVGRLLRDIDRMPDMIRRAFRVLALIFVRPGELIGQKWSNVVWSEDKMVIPFAVQKMRTERKAKRSIRAGKDFEIPLSKQAVAELRALHKLTGDTPYLFPSLSEKNQAETIGEKSLISALNRFDYQGIHCPHGFRSTASTILNDERMVVDGTKVLRWPEQHALIEVQLDHDDSSTRAIYNRGGRWEERVELMQLWADRVDEMRGNDKPKLRLVA